jgi:hypothetical protein
MTEYLAKANVGRPRNLQIQFAEKKLKNLRLAEN